MTSTHRVRARYDAGPGFVCPDLADDLEQASIAPGSLVLLVARAGVLTSFMALVWGPVRDRVVALDGDELVAFSAHGHHRGLRRREGRCPVRDAELRQVRGGRGVLELPGVGRYRVDGATMAHARTVLSPA